MRVRFKLNILAASIFASGAGLSVPVLAESDQLRVLEEIVVTARRKSESIQDAPLMVNAVTDQMLQDLNITNFADLEGMVSGLTLNEDAVSSSAALRGVQYDVLAQTPASVEFYLNDVPATALQVMQKVFDVSQVEVLRGPQGTLRGRSSPSGSITVTSKPAQFDRLGGYIDATISGDGDQDYQGAVNVPLIKDRLALRVAGFWSENNINGVSSVYNGDESAYDGRGYRFTLSAQPIEDLYLSATYQRVEPDRKLYPQVESVAGAERTISASDRKAVSDVPQLSSQTMEITTLNVSWDFTDSLQLNYTGGYTSDVIERADPSDPTNALTDDYSSNFDGAVTTLYTDSDVSSHEIRLQSTDPLFGKLDFILGGLYQDRVDSVSTTLTNYIGIDIPGVLSYYDVVPTTINNYNDARGKKSSQEEYSVFLNLNYAFTEYTSASFGARHINFSKDAYQETTSGRELQDLELNEDTDVFTATLQHHFNEDIMGYFSWGTSWRYGPSLVGIATSERSALLDSFIDLPSETSESFEIGVKSDWLDQRLRVNAAIYHQTFENFASRVSGGVFFKSFDDSGSATIDNYALEGAVPVTVNGVEVEINYLATQNLSLGAMLNYSKGEIDNGVIPCNDYQPNDGQPDTITTAPTLAQIDSAAGSDYVTSCVSSAQTNFAPDYSATFRAEYNYNIAGLDAYVRGLYSFYGETDNDPNNSADDISSYGLLNLYAGLRDPGDRWSVMVYVKNAGDVERVVSRSQTAGVVGFRGDPRIPQFTAPNAISDYRTVKLTAEREFGVNFRYNF